METVRVFPFLFPFMNLSYVAVLELILLSVLAFWVGVNRCRKARSQGALFYSTPGYYGALLALRAVLPSFFLFILNYVLFISPLPNIPLAALIPFTALLSGGLIFYFARFIRPEQQATHLVEKYIMGLLLAASFISVLITVGIVFSVIFEASIFFKEVSFIDFITGTNWNPNTAFYAGAGRGGEHALKPQFGSLPLFAGTFMITFIAMLVAGPIGLFSAVFMSEYASAKLRKIVKPILEVLAGIPTVVYGFFAAITVSPAIVKLAESMGLHADAVNALSPGLVMGIMIIPFVSSLSDDVITAVPRSMREGSYALGATSSETIKRVLLPAALPGIISAFLLAVSRAIGETMIVVMAAGLRANMTWNPLETMTTVTVRIVDALTGDQAFNSLETLSAFALGFVLLCVTFILNVVSAVVIRKYHEKYE